MFTCGLTLLERWMVYLWSDFVGEMDVYLWTDFVREMDGFVDL